MAQPRTSPLRQTILPLLALAAPMLLGQAGQVLLQITDTVMIGHVGAVGLAGAALAGNLVMVALYFSYGALGAVAPRVAQAWGAKALDDVAAYARAGAVLASGVGIFVALALTALIPALPHLGQPAEVVEVTGPYLLLIAWSMPAAMLTVALGQTAEAVNRPWPVLALMAGTFVLNLALNFVFIFGHFGFPAMGLMGAGLATFLARWLQTAALLAWLRGDASMAHLGILRRGRRIWAAVRDVFREGLPVAGQDVLEGGAFAVGSLMVGWFGTVALAANQVTIGIASLAWMFPLALASATGVRVAQASGAGDLAGARRSGLVGVALGVALMACCAVVYVTGGNWLAGFFTTDPEVAKLAGILVTIAGIYQISDAIQSISLGALRGLLDNRVPFVANAVCYWVLSLPTVYLLAVVWDWGAVGVWVGYLPWMVLTGLFFLWRFVHRTRGRASLPGK